MKEKFIISVVVIGFGHGVIENEFESFFERNKNFTLNSDEFHSEIKFSTEWNKYGEISQDGTSSRSISFTFAGDIDKININDFTNVQEKNIDANGLQNNAKIKIKSTSNNYRDFQVSKSFKYREKNKIRNIKYSQSNFKKYNKLYNS